MPDLKAPFGGDLNTTIDGDLDVVTGSDETTQLIVTRLATNPGAYLWHLDYGAGLPAMIGDPVSAQQIQGIVAEQMAMEIGVDQTQPVTIAITSDTLGSTSLTIRYTAAEDGSAQTATVPT